MIVRYRVSSTARIFDAELGTRTLTIIHLHHHQPVVTIKKLPANPFARYGKSLPVVYT